MENLEKRIASFTKKILEDDQDFFLVDVLIKGSTGNQKVLIFIDGDNGVNIDQCGRVSRELGLILEEEDIMLGKYFLEVSSPGLDHPIRLKRQYRKSKGRELEVETKDGEKVKGRLLQVLEEAIVLKTMDSDRVMSFSEINQSKIEVSFK